MPTSTIQIQESTKHALDQLKIYPSESYAEVIKRLIGLCSEEKEITDDEWIHIQKTEEEYKSGKKYSLEEIKRRMGDE